MAVSHKNKVESKTNPTTESHRRFISNIRYPSNHYILNYLGTIVLTGLGISVSRVTARSHESKSLHDGQSSKDGPDEVTKSNGGLSALTGCDPVAVRHTDVSSESGSAGEPEERGEGENTESDHVVVHTRSKERCQGEVEEHEDGPDDTEEQE